MFDYIKKTKGAIIFYFATFVIFAGVFGLYNLDFEPLLYAALLAGIFGVALFVLGYVRYLRKIKPLSQGAALPLINMELMPEPVELTDTYYQEIINKLYMQCNNLAVRYQSDRQDMVDYYTAWIHQIKTPIAVMQMILKAEDTDTNRELLAELFRIENYVEMVLTYIRLGSTSNDLVIKEYALDELIKKVVRKYASQFIRCKLKLDYEPTDKKVLTDEKWFVFILEQIISNAIKYTYSGGITIIAEDDRLIIKDTGIGIAPEDLPRIFEKGYTGYNGRGEAKSTGLGLYLSKEAADKISLRLSVESEVKVGSSFVMEWDDSLKVIE